MLPKNEVKKQHNGTAPLRLSSWAHPKLWASHFHMKPRKVVDPQEKDLWYFCTIQLHGVDQYPNFGFLNRDLHRIYCPRSMFWACRNPGLDGDGHVAQSPKCLIIMAGCIGAVWRPQCPSFLAERRKKSRKVASPRPHHCLSYLSPNRSWGARQAAGLAAITFLGIFAARQQSTKTDQYILSLLSVVTLCLLVDPFRCLTTSSQAGLLLICWWKIGSHVSHQSDSMSVLSLVSWSLNLSVGVYLHGRKSNTVSFPPFSRDICRMFPQNIWKLNQHRTSWRRESFDLIHTRIGERRGNRDRGRSGWMRRNLPWKRNLLGLGFAHLTIVQRERLIIYSPSPTSPRIILTARHPPFLIT